MHRAQGGHHQRELPEDDPIKAGGLRAAAAEVVESR